MGPLPLKNFQTQRAGGLALRTSESCRHPGFQEPHHAWLYYFWQSRPQGEHDKLGLVVQVKANATIFLNGAGACTAGKWKMCATAFPRPEKTGYKWQLRQASQPDLMRNDVFTQVACAVG